MKFDDLILMVMFYAFTTFGSYLMILSPQIEAASNPGFQVEGDPQRPNPVVIFADKHLTGLCALGAVAGALTSILAFPGKDEEDPTKVSKSRREMASKFLVALISGVTVSPVVVRWSGIVIANDHMIFVSTVVSFFSVTVLHKSLPMIESNLGAWVERVFTKIFGK